MHKYFFNIVLNGSSTLDRHGQYLRDEPEARLHAHKTARLLIDLVKDPASSFIAVSGEDGRLVLKVSFPSPSESEE